jgi:hypothetical protein
VAQRGDGDLGNAGKFSNLEHGTFSHCLFFPSARAYTLM